MVLMFDSPAGGMVCRCCHERLMILRKEAVVLTRDLGTATSKKA